MHSDAQDVGSGHPIRELVNWLSAHKNRKSALLRAVLRRVHLEWFARPDEFDKKYRIETRHTVWRKRLAGKDTEDYEAVSPILFSRAIACVPRNTFIDLGCGKGRALILAHEAGFRDLIGIEISSGLAEAAARNLQKLKIDAQILQADAASFPLPDRPVVLFLYNPFGSSTMEAVIEKLLNHRRAVHVIYVNPKHGNLFSGFQRLYGDRLLSVFSNCAEQMQSVS
jgi:SAM-dependent methyltransferase